MLFFKNADGWDAYFMISYSHREVHFMDNDSRIRKKCRDVKVNRPLRENNILILTDIRSKVKGTRQIITTKYENTQ